MRVRTIEGVEFLCPLTALGSCGGVVGVRGVCAVPRRVRVLVDAGGSPASPSLDRLVGAGRARGGFSGGSFGETSWGRLSYTA